MYIVVSNLIILAIGGSQFYGSCAKSSLVVDLTRNVARRELSRCIYFVDTKPNNVRYKQLVQSLSALYIYSNNIYTNQQSTVNSCSNPLYVVLRPEYLSQVSLEENKRSCVWLIFTNSTTSVHKLLQHKNINYKARVIVAKVYTDEYVETFSVNRISPKCNLNVEKYSLTGSKVFRHKDYDLQGLEMKSILIHDGPSARYVNSSVATGFIPEIWHILQSAMNFSTFHTRYNGSTGSVVNGSWNGIIGEMVKGSYDVALCELNTTPERMTVLDMPQAVMTSRYQVYLTATGVSFGYAALLEPFDLKLWLALLAWIISGGFFFVVINKILSSSKLARDSPWCDLGFFESSLFVLQALTIQGAPQVPKGNALRILFFISYAVAAVVVPSYSASLISSLTHRSPILGFHELEDVGKSGYHIYLDPESADYNFFTTSNNPAYRRIGKVNLRFTYYRSKEIVRDYYRALIDLCQDGRGAIFASHDQMDYLVDRAVRRNAINCTIIKLTEKHQVLHQTVAFKKGWPYTNIFKRRLMQLREFGIINREYNKHWVSLPKIKKKYNVIYLYDVSTIFVAYSIGILVAIFVLFYEIRKKKLSSTNVQ